jgi:hypothetical protein
MNALAQTHADLRHVLTQCETAPREGLRRLNAAVARYRNDDSASREHALEAFFAGRPAFWTTTTYHSARAVELPNAINRGETILDALAGAYPEAWKQAARGPALDTLVPLNHAAALDLVAAYAAFGTMIEADELELRRS